jgi:DNA-binding beta-propeller fold protein YncE
MAGLLAGALATAAAMVALAPPADGLEVRQTDKIGGRLHAEMYPSGLDTAPDGSVVVADTGNNRIARYDKGGAPQWRVGTFGSGRREFENPRDVAVDSANNVYVADSRNDRIVKLSKDGEWLGQARGFSVPLGVSAKGRRIYVADTGHNRVVVLNRSLAVRDVLTANGACSSFVGVRDAQADESGNVYVAGYATNEIYKLSPSGECLLKWGGTGTGNGQFRTPYGVDTEFDPVTHQVLVYVAEGVGNRVQVFRGDGTFVAKFGAFGQPHQVGTFTTNRRVAVARGGSGDVWIADLWGNRIERWDRTAAGYEYEQTVGKLMPAPSSSAAFHEPRGLAFTPSGNLVVADTVHHSFHEFRPGGRYVRSCGARAAEGTRLGQFNWPRGVAVDPATGDLWVADTKQNQLQVLTQECRGVGFLKDGPAGRQLRAFEWPYDIAIRQSGAERAAFVVDTYNHRIKAYDVRRATWPSDNKGPFPKHVWGAGGATGRSSFRFPSGVAVGPDGSVYVADRGNDRIVKLSYSGRDGFRRLDTFRAGRTLDGPEGVAVDSRGRMYVADSNDNQVVVLNRRGAVRATIKKLSHPANLEIGPDGRLYVSDTYADVVRVYTIGR